MTRIAVSLLLVLVLGGSPTATPAIAGTERLLYALREVSTERGDDRVITRIFSIDPTGGAPTFLFSDEHIGVTLLARRGLPDYPGEVIAPVADGAIAPAVEKRLRPGRWYASRSSVYLLALDGSNSARRAFETAGTQLVSELVSDLDGRRVAYTNFVDDRLAAFVQDVAAERPPQRIDLETLCPGCVPLSLGFTRDGTRLFVTLVTGDERVTPRESDKKPGNYLLPLDGSRPTRVTFPPPSRPSARLHPSDAPAQLIGELPDSAWLVIHHAQRIAGGRRADVSFVERVSADGTRRRPVRLRATGAPAWFKLSSSGRLLAFVEKRKDATGERVWVKNLKSGDEREILTVDAPPAQRRTFFLGLVGWTVG